MSASSLGGPSRRLLTRQEVVASRSWCVWLSICFTRATCGDVTCRILAPCPIDLSGFPLGCSSHVVLLSCRVSHSIILNLDRFLKISSIVPLEACAPSITRVPSFPFSSSALTSSTCDIVGVTSAPRKFKTRCKYLWSGARRNKTPHG